MSKLSGFSDRASMLGGTPRTRSPKTLKEITSGVKDRTPSGYDPDVWYLAQVFEYLAEKDNVSLRSGLPLIAIEMGRRIDKSGIENQEVPFTTEQLLGLWDRRVYSEEEVAQVNLTGPMWRQFVEAMIWEYWSSYRDEDAASEFCRMNMFIEMWDTLTRRFDNQRLLRIYSEMQAREEENELRKRASSSSTAGEESKAVLRCRYNSGLPG